MSTRESGPAAVGAVIADAGPAREDFDAMVDRCIAAGRAVRAHGTPEMQAAMRILLFEMGRELTRRDEDGAQRLEA